MGIVAFLKSIPMALASLAWMLAALPTGASPAPETVPAAPSIDWAKAREFWAFQSPEAHAAPEVRQKTWPRVPMDYFILRHQEDQGRTPGPEADAETLLRRLTLDLTGLLPTAEERQQFLQQPDRDAAYAALVDDLLSRPAFGERMASIWLSLARYAEDQAHQVGNSVQHHYPNAWMYRDWVIQAFNQDLPYDQFIRLQLAADKLGGEESPDLVALGFMGLGHKYYSRGRLDVQAEEWADRVDTTTRAFLGLTVACARCHDHKFDPITMRDYYALAGVFASTEMWNRPLSSEAEEHKKDKNKYPSYTMHIVKDGPKKVLPVYERGNVEQPGEPAPRRFLEILGGSEAASWSEGSGRLELAEAIASQDNPLTARVWVNRVWMMMFGQPLVGTPSNFGSFGDRPTHPELLDDLAVRFMRQGWSIKQLVREIALSATYRQISGTDPQDPSHCDYTRMLRRRMSVETWRDSILAAAGTLDRLDTRSMELNDPTNHRRTVYARISRLSLDGFLMNFDYPDANVHTAQRSVTTTPLQKLWILNSPFMLEQASHLASQLQALPVEDADRIREAYLRLYAREPATEETELGLRFLRESQAQDGFDAWSQYAQVLLAANEFFHVD